LKLLPVVLLLGLLLAACTAQASSPDAQLGGLTRVSRTEKTAGDVPAVFSRIKSAPVGGTEKEIFTVPGRECPKRNVIDEF